MKLIKIYVSSFGKIKDYEINLTDGLNTIKQDNGWGKSTLTFFIKCMFYGIKDSKRSIEENERIKYKPWNSTERFGGYVIFEWNGQEFKLERFFGTKQSEDTVRIFDNKTGKEFADNKDLGSRIFQIDEDGFLSTTFFSQSDVEIKSNTSLTNKFNDTCDVSDSKMYDKAVSKIGEKTRKFKYSGGRGLIPETKEAIFLLNEKIERSKIAVNSEKSLKEEETRLEKEISELNAELEKMRSGFSVAGRVEAIKLKKERIEKLGEEIKNIKLKLESAKEILNGKKIDGQEVEALKVCVADYENNNQKSEVLSGVIKSLESEKQVTSPTKKNIPIIFAILFAVFTVVGIVCLFSTVILGIISLVLAIISAVFFVLFYKWKGKENSALDYVKNKKDELKELTDVKEKYVETLEKFFSGFNVIGTYSEKLTMIESALKSINEGEYNLSLLQKEMEELSNDRDVFSEIKSTENVSELKAKIEDTERLLRSKTEDLSRLKGRISVCENEANMSVELEGQKAELEEKLKKYEYDLEIFGETLKFLESANEKLKAKYRLPLEASLNKYLNYITGDGISAKIDTDLIVSIDEKGIEYGKGYFSKGYQNLFEICKRFALTDVLFKAEKPFIILDDPFYNLDDEKLKSALGLILKLKDDYQILYLVCHESRVV